MRCASRSGAPVLLAAAGAVLATAGCGGSSGTGSSLAGGAPQRAPFTIGAVFSLTGGGDVYGPQQRKGAELAVEQINAAGGVDGAPLRLVVRDDRSDPVTGAARMRTLIASRRVVAVLGPTLSLVAVRADPVANALHTPVLAVSNTVDRIVGDCAYPCAWIWRDSLGERVAVRANVAAYVKVSHPGTAVTVQTAGDVLGTDDVDNAVAAFRANGVRMLGGWKITPQQNVAAEVRTALAKRPDVLFVGTSFGTFAAQVMAAARKDGFTGAILGGNTFNSSQTLRLAGKAGLGARSGAAWWSGNDFPANGRFITSYRQAYGAAPDQFAAQAYVGVEILADALHRAGLAGRDATLVEQRAALQRALGDVAISTVLGPFRFTASHDVSQIAWILAMNGQGRHRLVGFCNPGC